jgi:beta-lactam-binding protein with PASTA domain
MQKKKNIHEQLMNMPIIFHLVAAIFVLFILLFFVLKGLDVYTHHNKAVIVPDVKGLQIEEAALFFENTGLRYHVIDSVFSKKVTPGAIVEVTPLIGTKVKRGRIISVTLNAKDVERATIPDVWEISVRQADAQIRARGFSSVEIKYVPGEHRDEVVGVELNGKALKPGESVPLSSALVLKVSEGNRDSDPDETDSVQTESGSNGTGTEDRL